MTAGLFDPEFLIGAALADGRFKIVARVGAGSMALVYRAFDHRLETEVVVKVPKKQKLEDPGLRERFRRESRLLVQLQHPHIVRVLDIGLHSNVPFVVMQYLSGGCLLDRMQGRNGQPTAVKVHSIRDWVLPVAKALDYAHQQQVIHRDVKPANILFDHAGNAFLGDFGLTKIMHGDPVESDANETAAGFVVGTPNFVAPEIVLGKDYDGRADQYSLAISVYHALIGQPPMHGKTPSATMVNQTRRVLPLLNEVRRTVPEMVAVAVAKALAKDPAERFESCTAFAEAVNFGLLSNPANNSLPGSSATSPSPQMMKNTTTRDDSTIKPNGNATFSPSSKAAPSQKSSAENRWAEAYDSQDDSQDHDSPEEIPEYQTARKGPKKRRPQKQSVTIARAIQPGVFACPRCQQTIRLRQEHAGRNGRCIQCQTRLKIAADLSNLIVLPASNGPRDPNSGENSADDLIVGEKLFGLRLDRKIILIVGVVTLIVVIATTALFVKQMSSADLEAERKKLQEQFMNLEE